MKELIGMIPDAENILMSQNGTINKLNMSKFSNGSF